MRKPCVMCGTVFDAKRCQKTCSDDCAAKLKQQTKTASEAAYQRSEAGKENRRQYDRTKLGKAIRRKAHETYRKKHRAELAARSLAAYHANKDASKDAA